ncbi:MAG: hypothetical protein WCY85_08875 [Sulfurimonas sp.]|jgi:hypothetical protein
MQKLLKYRKNKRDITIGTSFANLSINTNLDRLVELLGQVSFLGSGDDKVQLEWAFYKSPTRVFTIYDYKENKPIHEITDWHVGAKGFDREEIVDELLKIGFTKDEIVLEN